MRYSLAFLFALIIPFLSIAQQVEDEIDFQFVKAKYLLETERYEDAIREFTNIIKQEESYTDALILRAQAKYNLGAYKGTKLDVLQYAELKGLTSKGTALLGKAFYKLDEKEAALNTLEIASKVVEDDARVFQFLAELYHENEELLKACENWEISAKLGSSKAAIDLKRVCGSVVKAQKKKQRTPKTKAKIENPDFPKSESDDVVEDSSQMKDSKNEPGKSEEDTLGNPTKDSVLKKKEEEADSNTNNDSSNNDEGEPNDEGIDDIPEEDFGEDETSEDPIEDLNVPSEDDTPNDIEIDEDLSLTIYGQELGLRKVLNQPNILILSDEDGIVAIDICVNKRGKVETAQFNSKKSTIGKKSLISLAIRKSKDFWFEKSDYKEQCGVILFKIKGS